MARKYDEVFVIEGEDLRALPARPLRAGLFGTTLEDALQTLIERYPEVLPGKQMNPSSDDPPRFVLLCREMSVGGWSLDHLLVDHRGVLTLVEAKLIQNPEARRSVIGQIMEYAATAVETWGNGRAREKAAGFWSRKGRELEEVILERFGDEIDDAELFWDEVENNLQRGRIRLIIAADELHSEVRRTIEYLNTEMRTAEIYGLELRFYGGESESLVLVPNLVGQTQAAADRKGESDIVRWTVARLRNAYDNLSDRDTGARLRQVLDWAVEQDFFMESRAKNPGFGLRGRSGDRILSFQPDWTFCYLNERYYPNGAEERDQLVAELKGLSMYHRDFNPQGVEMGKNLDRELADLGDDEFRRLLDILSRFCAAPPEQNALF